MLLIRFLKLFLILFFCGTSFVAQSQETYKPIVVLELFTSQGCSSCPIADELLETLKSTYAQEEVFVLSYHVDYWNRLGWKDPFSQKGFSDYQSAYAVAFHSRNIYTPQLVVNGITEFVGGNKQRAVQTILEQQQKDARNHIALQVLANSSEEITIAYKIKGTLMNNVTLALVVSERVTKVSRGENRNRTLKNANIVAVRSRSQKSEGVITLEFPDWIDTDDQLSVVGFAQNKQMKITGASRIKI